MRKITDFYNVNENLKIKGDNILGGDDKTYEIDSVVEELKELKKSMSLYLNESSTDIKSVTDKINETVDSLTAIREEKWKYVKLYNGEWIPLMDDKK